jgi:hypothetical protein
MRTTIIFAVALFALALIPLAPLAQYLINDASRRRAAAEKEQS